MRSAGGISVIDWPVLLATAQGRRQVLLVWMAQRAQADGYSLLALAQVLGVPHGYLYTLYAGQRDVANLDEKVIAALARYLGQPAIVVRCAAGEIKLSDFFTQTGLEEACRVIQESLPELAALCERELPVVAVFAAHLAGLSLVSRRILRDLLADGPGPMRMRLI